MPRSMTGQGHAHEDGPHGVFTVELRTVNNRGFKLSPRLSDALGRFEPQIEALLRGAIRRGTIQLNARWQRPGAAGASLVNEPVVEAYFRQLDSVRNRLGSDEPIDFARLAMLPGALQEPTGDDFDEDAVWAAFSQVLAAAVDSLNRMRDGEGAAMAAQLEADLSIVGEQLEEIRRRAPQVVESYRERLRSKVDSFLQKAGHSVEPHELLREVQIFADRSDTSEEITRLDTHIGLFRRTLADQQANGRKLDFVIQEMLRETNTIGSKASDAEIAHNVVEIKCALERMRELVQNLE